MKKKHKSFYSPTEGWVALRRELGDHAVQLLAALASCRCQRFTGTPQSIPVTELPNVINTFDFEKSESPVLSVLRVSQKRKGKCSGGKLKKLVLPH